MVISVAYVPSWLPGGRYKQLAAKCRSLLKQVLGDPFRYVKDEMVRGVFHPAMRI